MIVISKLNKPRHLKQVIHKDYRGNLTEIFLKNLKDYKKSEKMLFKNFIMM